MIAHNSSISPKIAWLIPCYNEAITIKSVISDIKSYCPDAAIYVYDNNSRDETAKLALESGAIVRYESRQGKGYVVRRMFEEIEADFYFLVDGDATYSIPDWAKLLNSISDQSADMAVASRLENFTPQSFRPLHVMGNKFLCSLIRIMFRVPICDMLSGYRVLSKQLVKGIALNAKGFEIETELTIQSLENNFRIKEIPTPYRERPAGSFSKLNTFHDGFIILFLILRLVKDYKPLTFFGLIFLACGILGVSAFSLQYQTIGLLLNIAAFFSLSTGIILNAISQRAKETGQILRKLNSHL